MFNLTNTLLKDPPKKRIFENFIALSVLQIANYALPLITIPYLLRILGTEKFGLVVFAQAFIQYFIMLTDYGFNLSATQEISIQRNNANKVSEIFSSVMVVKAILFVLSFLLFSLITLSFERFRLDWKIYFLTFGMVVGNIMLPVWLFQGMEKMKFITVLNFLSKLIFTILIFVFIKTSKQYMYVPLFNSMGYLVAGLFGILIALKIFGIQFILPEWENIKEQFEKGWHLFVSTASATIYVNSNTFLLGIFTNNNTYVGYYSVGEKIIRTVTRIFSPVSTATFPFISKKFNENYHTGFRVFFKLLKLVAPIALLFSLLVFLFSEKLSLIFLGQQYQHSVKVIRILSVVPFFGTIGSFLAYHLYMNTGLKHMISKVLVIAFVVDVTLNVFLIPPMKQVGASIALAITEIFVPVAFTLIFIRRKGWVSNC